MALTLRVRLPFTQIALKLRFYLQGKLLFAQRVQDRRTVVSFSSSGIQRMNHAGMAAYTAAMKTHASASPLRSYGFIIETV